LAGWTPTSAIAGRGMARHVPAAAVCGRQAPARNRVRRHSCGSVPLLAAGIALFLAAAQGTAWAQQGPSRLSAVLSADASQDAPEPYVPRDEEPPPGVLPRPWKTWTTGQDVDPLPRITLQLSGGMSFPCGGCAETTANTFNYTTVWKPSEAFVLDFMVNLTPNISVGLRGVLGSAPESDPHDVLVNTTLREVRFDVGPSGNIGKFSAGLLVISLKYPLYAGASSFLEFQSSEEWQGVAPLVRLGAGYAGIRGQSIEYSGTSGYGLPGLFIQSRAFAWMASAGIEFRLWHLSLTLESGVVDFGKPLPLRTDDYGLGVFTHIDSLLRGIAIGSLAISF
jgi:hypothetical protein